MPVLPTIPYDAKFETGLARQVKVVDKPNAFSHYTHAQTGKRVTGFSSASTTSRPASRAGSESISMKNSRAGSTSQVYNEPTYAMRPNTMRFRNTPDNTDPIFGHGHKKMFTLPYRGLAGRTPQHQDVNGHLARKRCIGFAQEQLSGTRAITTALSRTPLTPNHKGKKTFTTPQCAIDADHATAERSVNLRSTMRYSNSKRFDVPQMIDPRKEQAEPKLVTGREVFRRTSTTLDGVFYPSNTNFKRRQSLPRY